MSAAGFSLYQPDRELSWEQLIDELVALDPYVRQEIAHEEQHLAQLREALSTR